jgi:copper(I)-binding protein
MNSKNLASLILLISGFINPVFADETSLIIENAWIAEAPPVSKVMVAYMTVKNTGPKAIEIIRAESDLYSSIEFHETIHEDGMARMIRHDSLIISANNRLELKRGGPHLMLFNPTKRLNAGDTVNIKFTTKNNITKTVAVAVKKAQF